MNMNNANTINNNETVTSAEDKTMKTAETVASVAAGAALVAGVAAMATGHGGKISIDAKNLPKINFNIFTKAAHGLTFLIGLITKNNNAFKIQKATGEELDSEVAVVKQQSKEYKDQGALADEERINQFKDQKLTSYRYKVKDTNGKITSNTFEAKSKNDVIDA